MSDQHEQELANQTSNDERLNDIDALKSQIEQLESTKQRLLAESTKYKTRRSEVDELREQLSSYKAKELEQKGEWQKRLEMEQEQRLQLQNELESQRKRVLKANIVSEVANYAKDAYDVNDLLAQRDYASMIEADEETLEPNKESIKNFVDSLREKKTYLFKGNKVASMADAKPTIEKPKPKTFNQMSNAEKQEYMKNALSALGHKK